MALAVGAEPALPDLARSLSRGDALGLKLAGATPFDPSLEAIFRIDGGNPALVGAGFFDLNRNDMIV